MGFRHCIKFLLISVIVYSVLLFLSSLFSKPTLKGHLNILDKSLNRKQSQVQMLDYLMEDKIDISVTSKVYNSVKAEMYMSITKKVTTEQKPMSRITLNPEVNELLNVTYSGLKPPSLDDMNFLIDNKSICKFENLTLMILVHSAPSHFDERKAIRETWTNTSRYSSVGKIRTIFSIGRLQNSTLQALIEKEFMEYGDILQGNFVDSYKNLSLNSLYGYKWINQNCANAKFVMKADDDIVMNMDKLFHAVNKKLMFMKGTKEVACFRIRGSVYKNKQSKYFAGEHVFMNTQFTLPFCEGKFVFMTMDLIPDILESASITPLFWIEDIYWYGLVMSNIPDITYTRVNWGEKIEHIKDKAINCLQKNGNCKFFLTWADSTAEIKGIFDLMESSDKYTYTAEDFITATSFQDIRLMSVHR